MQAQQFTKFSILRSQELRTHVSMSKTHSFIADDFVHILINKQESNVILQRF